MDLPELSDGRPHMRRVQPLQLQEVVPLASFRVSYSIFGLESEAKLQSSVICLVILADEVPTNGQIAGEPADPNRQAALSTGAAEKMPAHLLE